MSAPLAVVIPARNEGRRLPLLLADLASGAGCIGEICIVDGGSGDATASVAHLGGARVLHAPPNRGAQLAKGIAATSAPWLLLLHADGRLPRGWEQTVIHAMAQGSGCCWAFHLGIQGRSVGLRVVERLVDWRTGLFQRPYGDQGLLVHRQTLAAVGGVSPIPLMEDLELILRLRTVAPVRMLAGRFLVDGRRWQQLGVLRTSWTNAQLRRAWRGGEDPQRLAERYGAYQKAQRRCWGSSSQP
ncbi:MAG: TIGR04283 family arsenosugar biosynthesis glycosyltransferase [Cyanobacteriota bacterium]|nr:TIGR04283 family arsenosugar biosynthesis glycosyltransferase [Cyanobacteriota bacterium]